MMLTTATPSLTRPSGDPLHVPALESLLNQATLRVDVVAGLDRCGSWAVAEPDHGCGLFHLVGSGLCQVESVALDRAVHLDAGDMVVLPHGDAHRLTSLNTASRIDYTTQLICGELHFPARAYHPLSHALPRCFVVRGKESTDTFRQLSTLMINVSNGSVSGRQLLLNKLADSLFSLAVCDYASRHPERRGLFAALDDTRICKLLHAVHDAPGKPWTMQSMAALACMSRSAFAERFTQLMRMPPMQYVTKLRVTIAEQWLRERRMPVALIAERLGYGSEAAFRRLFKRISGISPGRVRSDGPLTRLPLH
ncbi:MULTISPECIES: AraC family transcriptional regulator [Dyella]|uniref:AraC family transcriptional regulator n=2 Tax=Dyella TaxID=231454 RepID=A0A4R0YD35_9GAMM|nr:MULTISPECIES: AraC family transcriptional regulator [Dyella]TBR36260.1 AraC family transcriptional regulator [Dyella terrae]TCI05916.1 AraC family transcriptional regulator [Dyella soli]